jgi:ADP-ribose pyrophosphatase YjhB (NUDIX family)
LITCKFEDGNPAALRHVTADVVGLRGERVLMVKRAPQLLEGGKWALPGGYMERDELLADNARREFFEETGYECTNLRLLDIDSRPERPANERQNVTAVFWVDVGNQVGEPDHESSELGWFSFAEIAQMDNIAFGHDQYVAAVGRFLDEPFALPLLDGRLLSDL